MIRPIAISLSPNTEKDDVLLALKLIFSPWLWFSPKSVHLLEEQFAKIFGKSYQAFATNSGRSSLYVILKALRVKKGDEVMLQAFTCVAVPNAVLWVGATPIYVDIDKAYNIDPKDLEKKITKNTKAVIVQHTFGMPADLQALKRIAEDNDLLLIEDCAHSLGATFNGKKIGTFGDVAFFSFGRDKILSSVFGGMILVRRETERVFNKKFLTYKNFFNSLCSYSLKWPGVLWGLQQLWHPVAFSFILPLYNSGLGKIILFTLQKLQLLSKAVSEEEKTGKQPEVFPSRISPALAVLANKQLGKLERFNQHRKKIAGMYFSKLAKVGQVLPPHIEGAAWLRFPITVDDQLGLISYAKKRGILLGDWYRQVVAGCDNPAVVGYKWGSCPRAEEMAKRVVNLPTYPTLSAGQADRVVKVVTQYLHG